jgi:hypothetical protein
LLRHACCNTCLKYFSTYSIFIKRY